MSARVVLAFVLVASLHGAAAWMEYPYGNSQFNEQQEYGKNVTLACDDGQVPDSYSVQYWIRPDLAVMRSSDVDSFWTLDGTAGWRVSDDGRHLDATLLNERQFGFYYCVMSATGGGEYVVKRGINYDGPYFGDRWPKYRMNVITGAAAAAIFLVLCILLCLLARWCERRSKDGRSGDTWGSNGKVSGGEPNALDQIRAGIDSTAL